MSKFLLLNFGIHLACEFCNLSFFSTFKKMTIPHQNYVEGDYNG